MSSVKLLPRAVFVLVGLFSALVIIGLLSLVLAPGSFSAVLLVDHGVGETLLPYPLTFQNLMWLLLGAGLGDVAYRWAYAARERALHTMGLLPEDDRTVLVPTALNEWRQKALAAAARVPGFLPMLIDECILYFRANQAADKAQGMMTAMVDLELHRVDLAYTTQRYLAWVIPTTGFIGTVVGIARALQHVRPEEGEAIEEAMGPVVDSLGLAFNTTILALIFSAILVLAMQVTQRREEEAINASSGYCLRNLINRLYTPPDDPR